jgi:hypothetical protein
MTVCLFVCDQTGGVTTLSGAGNKRRMRNPSMFKIGCPLWRLFLLKLPLDESRKSRNYGCVFTVRSFITALLDIAAGRFACHTHEAPPGSRGFGRCYASDISFVGHE